MNQGRIRTVSNPVLSLFQSMISIHLKNQDKTLKKLSPKKMEKLTKIIQKIHESSDYEDKQHILTHERMEQNIKKKYASHIPNITNSQSIDFTDTKVQHACNEIAKDLGIHKFILHGDSILIESLHKVLAFFRIRKFSQINPQWGDVLTQFLYYYLEKKELQYVSWVSQKEGKDFSVFPILKKDFKIGLIADWGTSTDDCKELLRSLLQQKVDVVIHLGDIYYAGTIEECTKLTKMMKEVWSEEGKLGKVPFYSIPGNHDYYSYGYGFYPFVKNINSELGFTDKSYWQTASYLCLRTIDDESWQFLGMDTGISDYNPVNLYNLVAPKLRDSEVVWHKYQLDKFQGKGKTILLSHHQLFSANAELTRKIPASVGSDDPIEHYINDNLLKEFSPYFDDVPVWFWGHEHNLVIFNEFKHRFYNKLSKGRLIGCSGFEEFEKQDPYKKHAPGNEITISRNPETHNIVGKLGMSSGCKGLITTPKYYNHGYVIVDLKDSKIRYYQFPSWGDYCIPKSKQKAELLHSESL